MSCRLALIALAVCGAAIGAGALVQVIPRGRAGMAITPPAAPEASTTVLLPSSKSQTETGTPTSAVDMPFIYSFNAPGVLEEAPSAEQSASPYWFLDSGGRLVIANGVGSTIEGALPTGDRWRTAYARTSPTDTDDGRYPQNLFRLVTKESFSSPSVTASFFIVSDHFTDSPNRNASNGLLLMSRYQSGDTLYYAGIRVDGTAVIKKKYNGMYYTLDQEPLFLGAYDRELSPNLLPHAAWIALRMETQTTPSGVSIRLFVSQDGIDWKEAASAVDNGTDGAPAITNAGRVGIRTDFMDVRFRDVRVVPL